MNELQPHILTKEFCLMTYQDHTLSAQDPRILELVSRKGNNAIHLLEFSNEIKFRNELIL